MAGDNVARGIGFYTNVPDAEIERRIAIVRQAKIRVGRDLSDDELDALLEPTPCRRTRLRLLRQAMRDIMPLVARAIDRLAKESLQ